MSHFGGAKWNDVRTWGVVGGVLVTGFMIRVLGKYWYLCYTCPSSGIIMNTSLKIDKLELERIWESLDNNIYEDKAEDWWNVDISFSAGLHAMTPLRAEYFLSQANNAIEWTSEDKQNKTLRIVDVGCGGGILAEHMVRKAIIKHGFRKVHVTGIDLAASTIKIAQEHSKILVDEFLSQSMNIEVTFTYMVHDACKLSSILDNGSADIIIVADVLEHVLDVNSVIHEVSRILKPGGVFMFDTVNRTLSSYVMAIFLAQELPFGFSLFPSHVHDWRLFIQPEELNVLCASNNLNIIEYKGFRPTVELQTLKGILFRSVLHKTRFVLTNNLSVQYIGYAQKTK